MTGSVRPHPLGAESDGVETWDALYDWIPQAVIFDCDGVLMDSESCWTVAESDLFAKRELTFGSQEKALVVGKSARVAARIFARLFGEDDPAAIESELIQSVTEVIAVSAEPMPGAKELVTRICDLVPTAVASNSPRALLEATLDRGGMLASFPVRVAVDDVERPKPDPEIYERACSLVGVDPMDAVAFEDSPTGVAAARAAGMRVIGIPTLSDQPLDADVIIESFSDAWLTRWINRWATPK